MTGKRRRKLRKKRVFGVLLGFIAIIAAIVFSINSVFGTKETKADEKYTNIEIATISDEDYNYAITYPLFTIEEVNETISTFINKRIAVYKKSYIGKQMILSYIIENYSEQTITAHFTETISDQNDKTTETYTLNLNAADGSIVQLQDVFTGDYLHVLSTMTYAALKENNQYSLSNDELFEATTPEAENFTHFSLLHDSIVFNIELPNEMTTELAISKKLLADVLVKKYKASDVNKDFVKDVLPANLLTKLPAHALTFPLDKKVIALTFDDGPKAGTTNMIIDALKQYNGHATFFALGSMIERNPQLVKEMYDRGNEIASHSWSHPQLTKISDSEIQNQLERTKSLITEITGQEPPLFRPPYGSVDDRVRSYLGNTEVILWDVDTEDWKYRDKNHVLQSVMSSARDEAIVLMHDIHETSAKAAVEIINRLKEQDYELVTVSELREMQKRRELASK